MDPRRVNRFDHFYGIVFVHAALSVGMGLVQYLHDRDLWIGGLTVFMMVMAMFCACVYRVDMRRQRRENEQLIAEIEAATKMDPRGINQFDYTTIWVTVGFYCFIIGSTVAFVIRGASTWTFSFWIVYAAVAMVVWYDQAKRDWEEQVARNEELIRSIEAAITKV